MRVIQVALLFTLSASNALAFDIVAYCRQISDAVGGSYQIEKTCRDQEYRAKQNIEKMKIPDRITKYCTDVAGAVGGSYNIMEACIKQEADALNSLH
ncbi:MAG: hypothetical protein ACOZAI_07520 [Pseudomonadota bacterium]